MFKTKKPQTIEPRLCINNQTAFIVCLACGIKSSSFSSLSNTFLLPSEPVQRRCVRIVRVYKIGQYFVSKFSYVLHAANVSKLILNTIAVVHVNSV